MECASRSPAMGLVRWPVLGLVAIAALAGVLAAWAAANTAPTITGANGLEVRPDRSVAVSLSATDADADVDDLTVSESGRGLAHGRGLARTPRPPLAAGPAPARRTVPGVRRATAVRVSRDSIATASAPPRRATRTTYAGRTRSAAARRIVSRARTGWCRTRPRRSASRAETTTTRTTGQMGSATGTTYAGRTRSAAARRSARRARRGWCRTHRAPPARNARWGSSQRARAAPARWAVHRRCATPRASAGVRDRLVPNCGGNMAAARRPRRTAAAATPTGAAGGATATDARPDSTLSETKCPRRVCTSTATVACGGADTGRGPVGPR